MNMRHLLSILVMISLLAMSLPLSSQAKAPAKIALTVTVLNQERRRGDVNPHFTSITRYGLSSNPNVGTLDNDTLEITYSTPPTPSSPSGTYPIVASAAPFKRNRNLYIITVIPGTLTVK